jgi:hypothetical protein
MRSVLLLMFACGAFGQTCVHQVTRSPIGPALVFRNGRLLRQGADFLYVTAAGTMPTIDPVTFAAGDTFSVVFSRQVPLTLTVAGASVSYSTYQNWQETWDCVSGTSAPKLDLLESCSGSGDTPVGTIPQWDAARTYSLGDLVVYAGVVYSSSQCSNVGHQPDISATFWNRTRWDCTGLLRATVTKADGSKLVITGVIGTDSGLGSWSPVR